MIDKDKKVIGLIHAGWRGLNCWIVSRAVTEMRELGSDYRNIRAGIGPCICQDHYEFGKEAWTFFGSVPDAIIKKDGQNYLDLRRVVVYKLREAGIARENISVSDACTYCDESMFSYRRDGQGYGVMMTVFGILS